MGSMSCSSAPISPHYDAKLSNFLGKDSLFFLSKLFDQIQFTIDRVELQLVEELLFTTKLACGIWPSPTANEDMIKSAINLINECKQLADLGNCFGFYPVMNKTLDIQVSSLTEIVIFL